MLSYLCFIELKLTKGRLNVKQDITELYCFVDDFCKIYATYEKQGSLPSNRQRHRECNMSLSEMLTIILMFHTSYAKNFKYFYKSSIELFHREDFPRAVSYNRFVELMPRLFIPFNILLHLLLGERTGTYFIDATTIKVCRNERRYRNRVFSGIAKSGKSSMGFFYGIKLHAVINHKGEFVALKITKGNIDDREPVSELTKDLQGKIFADKGYIKQNLFVELYNRGLKMIHGVRKNMSNKLLDREEKLLLRKRNIIETVFDYLKNKMNIEHTRHRSPINAFIHIVSTLIAYSLKKCKPSIKWDLDMQNVRPLIPN